MAEPTNESMVKQGKKLIESYKPNSSALKDALNAFVKITPTSTAICPQKAGTQPQNNAVRQLYMEWSCEDTPMLPAMQITTNPQVNQLPIAPSLSSIRPKCRKTQVGADFMQIVDVMYRTFEPNKDMLPVLQLRTLCHEIAASIDPKPLKQNVKQRTDARYNTICDDIADILATQPSIKNLTFKGMRQSPHLNPTKSQDDAFYFYMKKLYHPKRPEPTNDDDDDEFEPNSDDDEEDYETGNHRFFPEHSIHQKALADLVSPEYKSISSLPTNSATQTLLNAVVSMAENRIYKFKFMDLDFQHFCLTKLEPLLPKEININDFLSSKVTITDVTDFIKITAQLGQTLGQISQVPKAPELNFSAYIDPETVYKSDPIKKFLYNLYYRRDYYSQSYVNLLNFNLHELPKDLQQRIITAYFHYLLLQQTPTLPSKTLQSLPSVNQLSTKRPTLQQLLQMKINAAKSVEEEGLGVAHPLDMQKFFNDYQLMPVCNKTQPMNQNTPNTATFKPITGVAFYFEYPLFRARYKLAVYFTNTNTNSIKSQIADSLKKLPYLKSLIYGGRPLSQAMKAKPPQLVPMLYNTWTGATTVEIYVNTFLKAVTNLNHQQPQNAPVATAATNTSNSSVCQDKHKVISINLAKQFTKFGEMLSHQCRQLIPKSAAQGGSAYITILGKTRKITTIKRKQYVTYQKQLVPLTHIKKLAKKKQ